ncbi:5-oxoprolinase subunit B family protein [Gordonia asplenii]|uniref:5-oxoprolinase subunit B family protein n=1 Tax=Gordonia asplenii TaxID=2725283 RepID=UPI0028A9F80C|nr:carboxyltransferase domain-containing protein [Gordonia asplenii]
MTNPAILSSLDPGGHRPSVTISQAGDRQVLIEYGAMSVDVGLNFRVQALSQILRDAPIHGVVAAAPGFRSLLITFDPGEISRARLISELNNRELSAPDQNSLVLPSRLLTLPIAFDDEMTREAVNRYRQTTRPDAPNVSDGDNIDYIVRYNGFADRDEFIATFLDATWWCAFMGYFPGLPSLFSLDPRTQISVPKYNPARMWTAEGAVGIGGPCVVLYPMEVPGSYQLFGRTLPLHLSHRPDDPDITPHDRHLFRPGDRVRFKQVTEAELMELRLQAVEGRYRHAVVDEDFVVAEHVDRVRRYDAESVEIREIRTAAASSVAIP